MPLVTVVESVVAVVETVVERGPVENIEFAVASVVFQPGKDPLSYLVVVVAVVVVVVVVVVVFGFVCFVVDQIMHIVDLIVVEQPDIVFATVVFVVEFNFFY